MLTGSSRGWRVLSRLQVNRRPVREVGRPALDRRRAGQRADNVVFAYLKARRCRPCAGLRRRRPRHAGRREEPSRRPRGAARCLVEVAQRGRAGARRPADYPYDGHRSDGETVRWPHERRRWCLRCGTGSSAESGLPRPACSVDQRGCPGASSAPVVLSVTSELRPTDGDARVRRATRPWLDECDTCAVRLRRLAKAEPICPRRRRCFGARLAQVGRISGVEIDRASHARRRLRGVAIGRVEAPRTRRSTRVVRMERSALDTTNASSWRVEQGGLRRGRRSVARVHGRRADERRRLRRLRPRGSLAGVEVSRSARRSRRC